MIFSKLKYAAFLIMIAFTFIGCEKDPEITAVVIPSGDHISIYALKQKYNGYSNTLQACLLEGVVISDRSSNNFDPKELFLMDGSGSGLKLRFFEPHDFNMGDNIQIKGYKLILRKEENISLIKDIPMVRAEKTDKTLEIEPILITLSNLYSNPSLYECCLIRIENVSFSKTTGDTYAFETLVTENISYYNNTINLHTEYEANFSNEPILKIIGNITAIYTIGNNSYNSELRIRNISDIDYGVTSFNVDFDSYNPINNNYGWQQSIQASNTTWNSTYLSFENNYQVVAQINSYYEPVDTWLISPVINFDIMENYFLSLKSGIVYDDCYGSLQVLISNNYYLTESMDQAEWIELDCTTADQSSPSQQWISSGDIDLSSYSGHGNIAFRYIEEDNSTNTKYIIDDLVLKNNND